MSKFVVTCDSACDYALSEITKRNAYVIPFKYNDEKGTIYEDDLKEETYIQFYENIRNGTVYKTSQINPSEYAAFFEPFVKEGMPVMHISLGTGVSNTLNNIFIASSMLEDDYPNVNIKAVDSKLASLGLGLLVNEACRLRDENLTIEEAYEKMEFFVHHLNTFYTTNTLTYFARGGRLSKVEAFLGNALKVNPILDCAPNGSLRVIEKPRGTKNAVNHVLERVQYSLLNSECKAEDQEVYICHADNAQKGKEMGELLVKECHFKGYKLFFMGPIIGAHTGPGLVAAFYFANPRSEDIIPISEIEKALKK